MIYLHSAAGKAKTGNGDNEQAERHVANSPEK
jgi:hypothetical protein